MFEFYWIMSGIINLWLISIVWVIILLPFVLHKQKKIRTYIFIIISTRIQINYIYFSKIYLLVIWSNRDLSIIDGDMWEFDCNPYRILFIIWIISLFLWYLFHLPILNRIMNKTLHSVLWWILISIITTNTILSLLNWATRTIRWEKIHIQLTESLSENLSRLNEQ